ncbi:MAG: class GN sortase [Gammaproteobacteria bacterium]|nr:class GN sortase [Gammaproteobacteria bacterium]
MIKPRQRLKWRLSTFVIIILLSISVWQLATAGWIHGKAIVAQRLLNISWHQTMANARIKNAENLNVKDKVYKPWPWADTWPIAKLIVPAHNIKQIILAGDSGNSLAFAPGHAFASAPPNTHGTSVISAHRDTHFAFLKDIRLGDELFLETTDETLHYKIYDMQVIDSKTFVLPLSTNNKNLVLVTCYPFNSVLSTNTLRYVVYAKNIDR